jgi:hypothetical protein
MMERQLWPSVETKLVSDLEDKYENKKIPVDNSEIQF